MFTIIGGDGKEYGPAAADQIRSWMAAGRANLDTRAKALGSDEWRRLGDFPEFTSPEGAPPVMTDVVTPAVEGELAGREYRLFAWIADFAIQIICTLPGGIVLGVQGLTSIVQAMQSGDISGLATAAGIALGAGLILAGMLLLLVVQVWLLSTRGQSIGKLIVGIRIVRVDGSRAGFVHAWLLRDLVPFLIKFVLGVFPIIGILLRLLFSAADILFIFRPDRRCIHDLIAGTKVIKAAERS